MADFPRVKVVNPNASWMGTECYIDGKKIDKVKSVDFRVAVDEVPTFTFETVGLPDIDMHGAVRFKFTPQTAIEAAAVLQKEFTECEQLREALVKSIATALKEAPKEAGLYEVAEIIAKRIVGLD